MVSKTLTMNVINERLYYLDALRAFALVLGVIFHAGLSFMPVFIGWAVMDINTSPAIGIFSLVSHSFRMPLFFLLAGFFTHMAVTKYGCAQALKSRGLRLGIPFIAGWFLLKPMLVSGWIMGAQSMRGEVLIGEALLYWMTAFDDLPAGIFTGTHLWFLYYLMIFTLLTVMTSSLWQASHRRTPPVSRVWDSLIMWLSRSSFALPLLTVYAALCLWFMNHWGLDTPDKSLLPHIPIIFLYGSFFILGWGFHQHLGALGEFSRIRGGTIVWCLLSVGGSLYFSHFESQPGHPDFTWLKAGFVISYAGMMWSIVILLIAFCRHVFYRPNAFVSFFVERAYWLYLVHLPLVVWLQTAFAELPYWWLIKLVAIVLITLLLSFLLYELLVKRTWLSRIVAGCSNFRSKTSSPR